MQPLLGTFVEIGSVNGSTVDPAIESAFEVIRDVQNKLSFQDPNSELSKLNRSLREDLVLSPLTIVALRLAKRMTMRTKGLFNFAVGGYLIRRGLLPNHGGPDSLEFGEWHDLELRGQRARLRRPIRICLDGIAKGYAVDLAVKAMKKHGLENGWVNAGGDLRVFGEIELPVQCRSVEGSGWLGLVKDGAMATSWTHKKFDPRFPSVIVSPSSEVVNGTWTVTAQSAWLADSLTKVASVAPSNLREELIASFGGRLTTFRNVIS